MPCLALLMTCHALLVPSSGLEGHVRLGRFQLGSSWTGENPLQKMHRAQRQALYRIPNVTLGGMNMVAKDRTLKKEAYNGTRTGNVVELGDQSIQLILQGIHREPPRVWRGQRSGNEHVNFLRVRNLSPLHFDPV